MVDLDNLGLDDICISDIAHSLSLICRFNGHCQEFYSVAQHSIIVADQLKTGRQRLWGLLHDAAEAYIGDIVTPIKQHLPEFKKIERDILRLVAVKYTLPWPIPSEIKDMDLRVLATEHRQLMAVQIDWPSMDGIAPLEIEIEPMTAADAKIAFLCRFAEVVR